MPTKSAPMGNPVPHDEAQAAAIDDDQETIVVRLSDVEAAGLHAAAEALGKSIDELAAETISAAYEGMASARPLRALRVPHTVTASPNLLFDVGIDVDDTLSDLQADGRDILECAHGMAYMLGVAVRATQAQYKGLDHDLAQDVLVRSIEGISLMLSLAVELNRGHDTKIAAKRDAA